MVAMLVEPVALQATPLLVGPRLRLGMTVSKTKV